MDMHVPPPAPLKGSRLNRQPDYDDPDRGLVLAGRSFEFTPPPPAQDLLIDPLVVPNLPMRHLPTETWAGRFIRFLGRHGIGAKKVERQLRWRAAEVIEMLRLSMSPAVAAQKAGSGVGQRRVNGADGRPIPIIHLLHPYQLWFALDLLMQLDDVSLEVERKYLELLLTRIIQHYGEVMGTVIGRPFAFEHESRDYFYMASRQEKMIKLVTSAEERFGTVQQCFINYFHGARYYALAVLRRERMMDENKLFFFYCRAQHFMARVDWNGDLQDRPPMRQLPCRADIMFFGRRDVSVVQRYQGGEEFATHVKKVLALFPA